MRGGATSRAFPPSLADCLNGPDRKRSIRPRDQSPIRATEMESLVLKICVLPLMFVVLDAWALHRLASFRRIELMPWAPAAGRRLAGRSDIAR
jgi:hypothetical protein